MSIDNTGNVAIGYNSIDNPAVLTVGASGGFRVDILGNITSGVSGTNTGSIAIASATASGLYTLTAPANAATPTLTLPTASNVLAGQFAGDNVLYSNTPVGATAAGTLALPTLSTQTANYVFAGPTSGAAAAPTFRALVSADLANTIVLASGIAAATQPPIDNSTLIATDAFVQTAVELSMATVPLSITGGTYSFASLGVNALVNYTATAGVITAITLWIPFVGSGYAIGDVVTPAGGKLRRNDCSNSNQWRWSANCWYNPLWRHRLHVWYKQGRKWVNQRALYVAALGHTNQQRHVHNDAGGHTSPSPTNGFSAITLRVLSR